MKKALDKCSFINVRDNDSAELIRKILPGKDISRCCDIALTVSDFFSVNITEKKGCNIVVQTYARYVDEGIIKNRGALFEKIIKRITLEQYRYDREIRKLTKELLSGFDNNVNIVISFQHTSKRGNGHYIKYAEKLKSSFPNISILNNMTVDEFINVLATGKYTFSVKMHPLIISTSYGTEAFAISQHYKMDAFMQWIDKIDHCFKNNSNFSSKIMNMLGSKKNDEANTLKQDFSFIEERKKEIYDVFVKIKQTVEA